jgi:hypothetical protein
MTRDFKIEVVVGGETYEFSTEKELIIDRDDLDAELAKQAANFAWFAVLLERIRSERLMLEEQLEGLTYEISNEVRRGISERKEKKPSEGTIKAQVMVDPRLRMISTKLRKIYNNEGMLEKIAAAMVQRKDCLIALARSRHLEMSAPSADETERMKRRLLG